MASIPRVELISFIKEIFYGESDFSRTIRRNKLSIFSLFVSIFVLGLMVLIADISLDKQDKKDLLVGENRVLRAELISLRQQLENCQKINTAPPMPVISAKKIDKAPKPVPPKEPEPVNINKKLDALRTKEDD